MEPLLKINNIMKNFGDLEVLKDISVDVNEGEVIVIIGPSGSGKSTYYTHQRIEQSIHRNCIRGSLLSPITYCPEGIDS